MTNPLRIVPVPVPAAAGRVDVPPASDHNTATELRPATGHAQHGRRQRLTSHRKHPPLQRLPRPPRRNEEAPAEAGDEAAAAACVDDDGAAKVAATSAARRQQQQEGDKQQDGQRQGASPRAVLPLVVPAGADRQARAAARSRSEASTDRDLQAALQLLGDGADHARLLDAVLEATVGAAAWRNDRPGLPGAMHRAAATLRSMGRELGVRRSTLREVAMALGERAGGPASPWRNAPPPPQDSPAWRALLRLPLLALSASRLRATPAQDKQDLARLALAMRLGEKA